MQARAALDMAILPGASAALRSNLASPAGQSIVDNIYQICNVCRQMVREAAETVADRIEQQLEQLILSGEYAPGAHINENALAARLGVSRAPVREACRLLQRTGLVRIVPNQGAYVHSLSLAEIVALFDVRACLGRLAGQQAAASIDRAGIA